MKYFILIPILLFHLDLSVLYAQRMSYELKEREKLYLRCQIGHLPSDDFCRAVFRNGSLTLEVMKRHYAEYENCFKTERDKAQDKIYPLSSDDIKRLSNLCEKLSLDIE